MGSGIRSFPRRAEASGLGPEMFVEVTRFPFAFERFSGIGQVRALDRGSDGTADQAVQPVVIHLVGPHFPFIDDPSAAGRLDAVFSRQMVC